MDEELTSSKCENILVLMYHHTRWVELVAVREVTAAAVAEALSGRWVSCGPWSRITARNSSLRSCSNCVLSTASRKFSHPRIIRKVMRSIESYMRTLKSTVLLCTIKFTEEWDVVLPAAAFAYRVPPHSTTGFRPFFLVVGQGPVLLLSRECGKRRCSALG